MYLLAFGLAPRLYKEIYKIPYPTSVLYVLLSDWLILAGMKVITLPRHWIKLSLLHESPHNPQGKTNPKLLLGG